MACDDYLVHPELCFPWKSLYCYLFSVWFPFSVKILNCEEAFLACCYTRVRGFCWQSDDLNHITASWVKSIESTIHLTLQFHGEVKHFDLVVSWQHLKMQLLGFLLCLISLWIYLLNVGNNIQPKFGLSGLIQEQIYLELSLKFWLTCFFSTERRQNYTPCFLVQLELNSFYSFIFLMFLAPKLQGNFEAKEHSLIILQNHDPEMGS